jgi:uncharacterized protein
MLLRTLVVRRLTSFVERLRGLIGKPEPKPGEAVWIQPCRQVHTFGMRYPIDVVHVDVGQRVLRVQTLRPWRIGRLELRAHGVLEMKAGEALRLGIAPGKSLSLIGLDVRASKKPAP